jgi:hypothetical protein
MAQIQLKIPDQLLIPFGGPKWKIDSIKVVGVSTSGTYIQSNTPLAYINKSKKVGLRLRDFCDVIPGDWPNIDESDKSGEYLRDHLKENCEVGTGHERRFLDLYFQYCREAVGPRSWDTRPRQEMDVPHNDDEWLFDALLPLPQAHLYQANPLDDNYSFVPSRMMKVDFAFWTGMHLVAVEIDGGSHIGSEAHVEKDRLLQRAGVQVVHITNSEIMKHGTKVIRLLLPEEVTKFWKFSEHKVRWNPLGDVPF